MQNRTDIIEEKILSIDEYSNTLEMLDNFDDFIPSNSGNENLSSNIMRFIAKECDIDRLPQNRIELETYAANQFLETVYENGVVVKEKYLDFEMQLIRQIEFKYHNNVITNKIIENYENNNIITSSEIFYKDGIESKMQTSKYDGNGIIIEEKNYTSTSARTFELSTYTVMRNAS